MRVHLGFVAAVAQLPGNGEAVLLEESLRLRVLGRGCAVEEVEVVRSVLDAVAQHVNSAPFAYFALKPRQELAPGRAVLVKCQGVGHLGLGGSQEGGKLHQVDTVLAVIVVGVAAAPAHPAVARGRIADGALFGGIARVAGQCFADQALEPAFGGIGLHFAPSSRSRGKTKSLKRASRGAPGPDTSDVSAKW